MIDYVTCKADEAALDQGCYFDLAAAERVKRFFEKYLRHSKGQYAGQPFELLAWQWDRVIKPAFGWKMPDGTRRFRHIKLFVPKKNGKSTLLSGISAYLLACDDEPGAEVFSCAGDKDQASIVFNECCNMIESSPALRKLLKARKSRKTIHYPKGKGFYKAVSSEAYTKEGLNIHGVLFDEIHTQPNSELWDTLKYGGAARRQPMFWMISTAGIRDEALFWWDHWKIANDIQNSKDTRIDTLGVVYAADPKDDWTSEATWEKANPSWHYTINKREFRDECQTAQKNASDEAAFKRYRLNIPLGMSSEWIQWQFWEACKDTHRAERFKLVDDVGETKKPIVSIMGLDLASTTDLTALAQIDRYEDHIYFRPRFWIPSLKVEERERSNKQRYSKWVEAGYLKVTDTAYTDYDTVHDDIIEILKAEKVSEIAIDSWNFTQLAQDLQKTISEKRLKTEIVPIRTGFQSISAATKELERLILAGVLQFSSNPVVDWMFSNMKIEHDANGNKKPDRKRALDKIDGIVALILALARLIVVETKKTSKYETQSLTFTRLT